MRREERDDNGIVGWLVLNGGGIARSGKGCIQ
jgi:hypothetical protein